jgi:trimeric autotransporter adhesin
VADYVVTATMIDGISDPATAAAAAMDKASDSADAMTAAVTRVGPSATKLAGYLDPATKASNTYAKALDDLNVKGASLSAGLNSGAISQAQYAASMSTLQQKVLGAQSAMVAMGPAATSLTLGNSGAAASATIAASAHAGFYREIVVLSDEVLRGNYSRIPGSILVMAERSGELNTIFSVLGGLVTGWPAIFGAGAAALGVLAYSAESQQRQLLGLQTALAATRDDYTAMGVAALAAAKNVAATTGFSLADTTAAAQTTTAAPNFNGSQQQIESLIRVEGDLSVVMGTTLPESAKLMATAMIDPGKEADDLAKIHFPGMSQALADTIKSMADSGDKSGAFGLILDDLRTHVSGMATASKTELQQALSELGQAFTSTGSDGKSFGQILGGVVLDGVSGAIKSLADLVTELHAVYDTLVNLKAPTASTADPNQSLWSFLWDMTDESKLASFLSTQAGGGKTSAMAAPAISNSAMTQIYDLAQQGNYGGDASAAQADLAVRIAAQESGGMQLNGQGGVLTSSAGALGEFQLMPTTAAGLGVDPTNQTQNVQGGLQYIAQLWTKYGGNTALVAMAYNWGPGNVDAFLAGTKTLGDVPAQTTAYVQSVAGVSVGTLTAASGGGSDAWDMPTGAGASTGVTNSTTVNDAKAAADAMGLTSTTAEKAANDVKLFSDALAQLDATGQAGTAQYAQFNEALGISQGRLADAISPIQRVVQQQEIMITQQESLTTAYGAGYAAVAQVTAANEAQAQLLAAHITPATADYSTKLAALTALNLQAATSQNALNIARQTAANNDQIVYITAEISSLGQDHDARTVMLADLQAEIKLRSSGLQLTDQERQAYLDSVGTLAQLNNAYQQQQQALSELSGLFSSAFDTIGSAMAQAFVQGEGAGIKWANVMDSVVEQVIQKFLQLAVLNPILNGLFGTTNSTLGSVASALGSVGGGSSGGTSGTSILSDLSTAGTGVSILNALGLTGPGGLSATLGLTGPDGLLSNLGLSGSGSLLDGVTGILNTSLIGGTQGLATTAGLDALGPGVYGPAQIGAYASGATVGTAITGVGLGYGAGSLAGGLIQNSLNKVGPAPEIGAAVGAISGAVIGSIVPGIGTVIGGLIGGLIGGGGGGLIGPHPENDYTNTGLSLQNGMLVEGKTVSQGYGSNAGTTGQDVNTINAALQALNLTIANVNLAPGKQLNVGSDAARPNLVGSISAAHDLAGLFPDFNFASSNSDVNAAVQGKSFASLSDLEALTTFLETTVPALVASVNNVGTLQPALDAVTAAFGPAIAQAQAFGTSTDALTAAEAKATAAVNDNVTAQITALDQGFQANYLSAAATISGNPADALTAQLYAFDSQATQQTAALKTQLTGIYGDSYTTTSAYATQMADLENSLGEQRLAIQQQYNDKLSASATSTITSLTAYVAKLQSSASSPLSPQAQYALAHSQFTTDATAAAGGDFNSLTNLPTDADSFLAASRAVNGSGAQYALDFQSVLNALGQAANDSPDVLTASVLQTETRTQTQQLTDALSGLGVKLDSIKSTLQQNSATPARIVGS